MREWVAQRIFMGRGAWFSANSSQVELELLWYDIVPTPPKLATTPDSNPLFYYYVLRATMLQQMQQGQQLQQCVRTILVPVRPMPTSSTHGSGV